MSKHSSSGAAGSYSLTHAGILVSVLGSALTTFLVRLGISEACAQELWGAILPFLPVAAGGVMSWVGRFRAGGVTALGVRE